MPAIPYQRPRFRNTGWAKEPPRLSVPVGSAAAFLEGDFVVLSTAGNPPGVNGTALPAPAAPAISSITTGGSVAAGTYFGTMTYLNANGETIASTAIQEFVTTGATSTITAISPPTIGDATGYRVYIGTVLGTYHLQGATTLLGTNFTSTTYSAGGAAPPVTNTTGLAAPTIPTVSNSTAGGSLPARTEWYKITYVNNVGETLASPETVVVFASSGFLAQVTSPAASGDATGYNVYATNQGSGQEVKQTATPIAIGTNWTEPTSGLVSQGVQRAVTNQPPTINGLPCILGLADHDYNATYGGPVGGATPGAPISDPFGRPNFNATVFGITEYFPGLGTEAQNAHVLSAAALEFEVSLVQAWDPGLIGQLVGLTLDTATNFFVADTTAANKIASIVTGVDGPTNYVAGTINGYGGPGDTGKRVAIKFLTTASVPV